jgi:glutathione S-transferase
MSLKLYHAAPSRSAIALWMLEEVGEPFELEVLNLKTGDNRRAEYLAINPMGKVPALRHGAAVITEVAAICCHLADAFPHASLSVPMNDPLRGVYLKWLFFNPGVLEPAVTDRAFQRTAEAPRSALGYGDFNTVMDVVAGAVAAGPYLMGAQFTAADVLIGSSLRWGMQFKLIPERSEFVDYVGRLQDRPAAQRAAARDAAIAGS